MLGATIAELRAEGMLPASGDGGAAAAGRPDRGQGGGAAVQPVPHAPTGTRRGLAARPGDEVHRRGDGHRHATSAPRSPSRRPPPTARCPTERHGVRLGGQPRQAGDGVPGEAAGRPRLPDVATEGTAEVLRRNGMAVRGRAQALRGAGGRPARSPSDLIRAGEVDLVINTPYGQLGAAHRRLRDPVAPPSPLTSPASPRCQGAAAAVQGIEALIRGDIGVRVAAGAAQPARRAVVTGVRGAAGRGDARTAGRCALASTRTRNC